MPEWRPLARLCELAPMQLAALCRTSFFDKAYAGRVRRPVARRHQMRLLEALEPAERSALYTSLHKLLAAAAPEEKEA